MGCPKTINPYIMNSKLLTVFVVLFGCTTIVSSCKKEKKAKGIDREMYDLAAGAAGFTYYKNSNSPLVKSSGSGHPQPYLKTRYNAIAASKLDSVGKIMTGATFPEGSLIVKDLMESTSSIVRFAILYKKSGHADADSKGWIWGYVNADGSVANAASKKGSACTGCHSQTDNIDYMLMNKYFP